MKIDTALMIGSGGVGAGIGWVVRGGWERLRSIYARARGTVNGMTS